MPKTKPERPKDAALKHIQEIEQEARAASRAVESLCAMLPDRAAVDALDRIGTRIVQQFCEQLGRTGELERIGKAEALNCGSSHLGSDLLHYARLVFDALIDYATKNPQAAKLIARSEEWPVIISTDPSWDIRRVVQNPNGPAAQRYEPLLKQRLGKATFWGDLTTRTPLTGGENAETEAGREAHNPYHDIVGTAAGSVSRWMGIGDGLREQGLPWIFDFPDEEKPHALKKAAVQEDHMFDSLTDPGKVPRFGDGREWVIAIKYYLYLTLAPEPMRSVIRQRWRNLREEKFAQFMPPTSAEQELHRKLVQTPPLSVVGEIERELYMLPSDYAESCEVRVDDSIDELKAQRASWDFSGWDSQTRNPDEPEWATWWRVCLQYQPEALFGKAEPLTASTEPAIVRVLSAYPKPGQIMSGFNKCVEAVLIAFASMAQFAGGYRKIQKGSDPLPRIRYR